MTTLPLGARQLPESPAAREKSPSGLRCAFRALIAGAIMGMLPAAHAQEPRGSTPAENGAKKTGSLFIAGGGISEKLEADFVELAGGKNAKIVVIPTASERADLPEEEYPLVRFLKPSQEQEPLSMKRLHTRNRTEADTEAFATILDDATGAWFGGGTQSFIIDAYQGTRVEQAIHQLLERGGVVGGTSAGAAIMGKRMIRRGNPPEMGDGLGFLPEAIVDQHFNGKANKAGRRERLQIALEKHPKLLGLGIDEKTAVVVRRNIAQVIGESSAEFFTLPSSEGRKSFKLSAGDTFDLRAGTALSKEQTSGASDVTGRP